MATLNDINLLLPLEIMPFQHDLDMAERHQVDGLLPITLQGADVGIFLGWAGQGSWPAEFENELQSLVSDAHGRKLLTTWLPLVTFRESFCAGGRMFQDADTQALMERLRAATREWRAAGVDTVDISGCAK